MLSCGHRLLVGSCDESVRTRLLSVTNTFDATHARNYFNISEEMTSHCVTETKHFVFQLFTYMWMLSVGRKQGLLSSQDLYLCLMAIIN